MFASLLISSASHCSDVPPSQRRLSSTRQQNAHCARTHAQHNVLLGLAFINSTSGTTPFGPAHARVMNASLFEYNITWDQLYCSTISAVLSPGLIRNRDGQSCAITSLLPQRRSRWPSVILAEWQPDEGQEGPSGIKVLHSCVCCLDASHIGVEGWVLGSSEEIQKFRQLTTKQQVSKALKHDSSDEAEPAIDSLFL